MRSFFSRLYKFFAGILLFLIGKAEDAAPEVSIAAEQDNYNRQIAEVNNGLARQAGIVSRLQAQIAKQKADVTALTNRIKGLLALNSAPEREKAAALAVTLNQTRKDLEENEKQFTAAEDMYKSLTRQRDTFAKSAQANLMAAKGKLTQVKIQEAQGQLAEMVSSTQFNPDGSGLSSLNDRLDERLADAQGKLRVAADAVASSPWALTENEQKAQEANALAEFEASLNAPIPIPEPKAPATPAA